MMKNKWLLLLSLLLSFTCLAAADSWWFAPDGTHARYRVPVTVTLKGSEQEQDFPVEQQLDFASLVDLGGEEMNPNSVVVVDEPLASKSPASFCLLPWQFRRHCDVESGRHSQRSCTAAVLHLL